MNEDVGPELLPEHVPLSRADLDAALDRLEDLVIGAIRMVKYVPEEIGHETDVVAENPESVLELPTPEREEEKARVARKRYI